jgi:peptide/nickel transport system substrate-binding protein/microcin C transport system substrate-binding protein
VDEWIDEARLIEDKDKRVKVLRKVYKQIAHDAPYIFMFAQKSVLYAHRKRIEKEVDTYKYGVGSGYWWMKKE